MIKSFKLIIAFLIILFSFLLSTSSFSIQSDQVIDKGFHVVINNGHLNDVNIIRDINSRFVATYSKHDKLVKIWDKNSLELLAEHHLPQGDIRALFSIDNILFAISKSALYRIDVLKNKLTIIFQDLNLFEYIIINNSHIVLGEKASRHWCRILAYDYKNHKKIYPAKYNGHQSINIDVRYFQNKYYVYVYEMHKPFLEIYDKNFSLLNRVSKNDMVNYENIKTTSNIVRLSKSTSNLNNFQKKKFVAELMIDSKIFNAENYRKKNDYSVEKKYSESGPYTHFFLVNNANKKRKHIISTIEDKGMGSWSLFEPEYIDTKNEIVIFRHDCSNDISYYVVDFNGNLLGRTQINPEQDKLDVITIMNNILLINRGKKEITAYKLNTQDRINLIKYKDTLKRYKKYNLEKYVLNQNIITLISWEHDKNHFLLRDYKKFSYQGKLSKVELQNGLFKISSDTNISLCDFDSGKLLAHKYFVDENTSITLTPEGYFDGNGNFKKYIYFVDNKLNVIQFDQLYNSLYRPDLVQAKIAGDPDGLVAEAASKLNLTILIAQGAPPKVNFLSPQSGTSKIRDITIEAELLDQGGGIGKIVWKLNGQTIGVMEDDRGIKIIPTTSNKSITISKHITLSPEQNLIELIVYNKAGGIASDPVTLLLNLKDAISEQPALHILAIGINKYRDKSLWLNYAVPDATEIVKQLQITGIGVFKKIDKIELYDQDATLPAIAQAFAQTAKKDKTNDVFILYLAGHGITLDGRYHFLPVDFRYRNEDSVRQKAINQDHLQKWLASLDSRKSLVLLDTCNSGSFTEAQVVRRGIAEKTAIDKLTRATGRATIAASTDSQVAYEGYKGHGVFTYALLQALSQADQNYGNKDNVTTTSELASFIDELVPEITYKKWGYEQIPQVNLHGRTFPIGVVR